MRADAQRNRDRIVEVARDLFREQGYDASLDEVARRAGVGPGTLYRHFPRRDDLLDAIMQSWVDGVNEAADKALAHEGSPRDLLVAWFEAYVALISPAQGRPGEDHQRARRRRLPDPHQVPGPHRRHRPGPRPAARRSTPCASTSTPSQTARLVGGVATVADQGDLDPRRRPPAARGRRRRPAGLTVTAGSAGGSGSGGRRPRRYIEARA